MFSLKVHAWVQKSLQSQIINEGIYLFRNERLMKGVRTSKVFAEVSPAKALQMSRMLLQSPGACEAISFLLPGTPTKTGDVLRNSYEGLF